MDAFVTDGSFLAYSSVTTLSNPYIVYATWITEVATGKPATEFPAEMLEPVANIKK